MDVLLMRPPQTRRSYAELGLVQEPLTSIFLGPVLAKRHRLRAVDLRFDGLERQLMGFRPQAAVVSVLPGTHGALDHVLPELQRLAPGVRVLLVPEASYGTEHVTERPLDLVHPLADALALGFYLKFLGDVVPEVLERWESGREVHDVPGLLVRADDVWLRTPPRRHEVGDPGVPDRTLLGRWRGRYLFGGVRDMAFVFTTCGCPYSCRFCTMSKAGGEVWVRRRADVLAELAALRERNVFLTDFEPLQAPEALSELFTGVERQGIRKRFYLMTRADSALEHASLLERLVRLGLRWVYLGLDGWSEQRLAEERKASSIATNEAAVRLLERLGIGVAVGFVVPPEATDADFAALRAYVRKLRPPMVDFSVETPLAGSRLFDDVEQRLTTRDWSLFDLHHAVLPTAMPLGRFYRQMTRLHLLAGAMSARAMLRHLPLRDVVRNFLRGPALLARSAFAARDHGSVIPGLPVGAT